jgi:hypothetical protein
MYDTAAAAPSGLSEPVHPPAISVGQVWPFGLFAIALTLLIYFVAVDEGAASAFGGTVLHEWVHDGRHLLGFPCH